MNVQPLSLMPASGGFDDFYRSEYPSLVAVATALTGSPQTGADLAQDAMLRAYRSWASVSRYERPGAWVRKVAINLATDSHRRRARYRKIEHRLRIADGVEPAAGSDDSFWAAVRELPERQRAVVALHYVEDMSLDTIANVLGIATGTVKSLLFSARKSLAKTLGAKEPQS
jgi:RNA polymerase sigma-70 factor (sigma-E family)